MNTTKKERLRTLQQQNGLNKDHFFTSPQGFTIITREGIEVIQSKRDIRVSFDVVSLSDDLKHVVLKATGEMPRENGVGGLVKMETFGESAPYNTRQKYPMAMAEKRALSRIVLKLSGFYEMGVFGQDESDDFVKRAPSAVKPTPSEDNHSENIRLVVTWLNSGNVTEDKLKDFNTNPKYDGFRDHKDVIEALSNVKIK